MKLLLKLVLLVTPLVLQAKNISTEDFNFVQRANRKTNAKNVRTTIASNQAAKSLFTQSTNGDQERYPDKRGSFGKGLRQLPSGLVDPVAYDALVYATQTQSATDFNAVPMGTSPVQRRLTSPQAGISFNMLGADSDTFSIPAPPTLASAETAGEMVELYWMALLRNVNFTDYQAEALIPGSSVSQAITALNALSDFNGPKNIAGQVDSQTLFRDNFPGVTEGPLVSQFFYQDVPFCETLLIPQYRVPLPTDTSSVPQVINDFVTDRATFLEIQKGVFPTDALTFDPTHRFIRNASDIGSYVHNDPLQWPYFCVLLQLLRLGEIALDQANPYISNPTQFQFADFFQPQFASMLSIVGELALRASWHQKWFIHRTIRPEYFAFLVSEQINGIFDAGINIDVTGATSTLQAIATFNSAINNSADDVYFLPQAFPEGSPTHPSYPAGHATVAGASITLLKAFFDESFIIPNPVVPNRDGTTRLPYIGSPLTIGGELNKYASNMGLGRNMAGVHWRSDATQSMFLGEEVALAFLEDWAYNNHIPFRGFTLTKFDGTRVTVGATQIAETY